MPGSFVSVPPEPKSSMISSITTAPPPALPPDIKHWSRTTLREKLVKIGVKVVRHVKYVTFQLAEVAIPRKLFRAILRKIAQYRLPGPRGSPA